MADRPRGVVPGPIFRSERDCTFPVCSDFRICVRYCPSFKDLFRFIDDHLSNAAMYEMQQKKQEEQE